MPSAITLKALLDGSAPATSAPDQQYELYDGCIVTLKAPVYSLVEKFDQTYTPPESGKNDKPPYELARERVKLVVDVVKGEKIDWAKVYTPILYRVHADFFKYLLPMELQQVAS